MRQQLVGSQLDGKFRLVRLLGVGGFGAVFLAEEYVAGHLMRRIALKVIRSDRNRLSEQVVELKSAVSLDHPCIVRCYSVEQCEVSLGGTTSDALYLVMELGSGNLLERVRSVQLSVDEAIDLSYEIASALHYLHARRLIHRDVKPREHHPHTQSVETLGFRTGAVPGRREDGSRSPVRHAVLHVA